MGKYRFNREKLEFVEEKRGIKGWIKAVFRYFIISILLAILYYIIFSLFVSTEEERALARETAILEEEYWKLQERIVVLDNTIKNLQYRDKEIYRSIFNAEPPVYSTTGDYNLFEGIDTTRMEAIVKDSKLRLSVIEEGMLRVDSSIVEINDALAALGPQVMSIPSIVPVRDFTIRQSGASIGGKVNPFYKTVAMHTGMDLLAASGTEVLAAADGVVETATRMGKKDGNSIVIDHGNGYVTKYNNLGSLKVRSRQKVKQGDVIGTIGMSGMSFAPHLHYEVWHNGAVMDPMNYFFASLTPQMYRDMAIIVANTGQSLD
ncbi:MAG: M23 family metallopeptidase [Bacteroidales bacterium]|nr:M23 family metallopeptidase [Bacteroidales bacterium]